LGEFFLGYSRKILYLNELLHSDTRFGSQNLDSREFIRKILCHKELELRTCKHFFLVEKRKSLRNKDLARSDIRGSPQSIASKWLIVKILIKNNLG